jgi:hypothetical protein
MARRLPMAKERTVSNRSSFSNVGARFDENLDDASAGGAAGSSPDSGSRPDSGFNGEESGAGSAGSSISPVLPLGETGSDGMSPALAATNTAIRASGMPALHLIRPDNELQHIAGFVPEPQDADGNINVSPNR